jgi:hypothetical protein
MNIRFTSGSDLLGANGDYRSLSDPRFQLRPRNAYAPTNTKYGHLAASDQLERLSAADTQESSDFAAIQEQRIPKCARRGNRLRRRFPQTLSTPARRSSRGVDWQTGALH